MNGRMLGAQDLGVFMVEGNIHQYKHIIPPPGFQPIARPGFQALAVAGTFQLERIDPLGSNYEGWIRYIGLACTDFTSTFFTLSRGGAPMRDYARINVPLGAPETPTDAFLMLSASLDLTLSVTTVGGVGVRWYLFGWSYPI